MEVISLSDKALSLKTLGALRKNKLLVLLGDRDITGTGVEVNFLGGKYKLPQGPALLSLRTGAPVVFGFFYRVGFRYIAEATGPIKYKPTGNLREDAKNLTQLIANGLEAHIRRYPEQWYVFQMDWQDET